MKKTLIIILKFIPLFICGVKPLSAKEISKEVFEEYIEGKHGYVILSLDEGMRIPVHPRLSGEFFSLEGESDLWIQILQPIYVYIDRENIYFSLDGDDWKTFEEFFTGNVSAYVSEEGGGLAFSAQLDHRK